MAAPNVDGYLNADGRYQVGERRIALVEIPTDERRHLSDGVADTVLPAGVAAAADGGSRRFSEVY